MNLRRAAALASAALLALTVSACAKEDTSVSTDSGVTLISAGKLTICTHLPYKPFEFTEAGEVVGFDIDVLKIAADAEGLTTEVVDTPWETIVSGEALNTGKCDVVAGAMTILPERQEVMSISEPYFEATQALITKKGSGITDLSQMAGKTLAVQSDTTGADYAKENAPEGTEIRTYEDSALMQAAVKTGQADAGVNDNGILYDYVKDNPDVEVVKEFQTGEQYGFGVKKDGNPKLLEAINAGIANKTAYDAAFTKWFPEGSK